MKRADFSCRMKMPFIAVAYIKLRPTQKIQNHIMKLKVLDLQIYKGQLNITKNIDGYLC